MRIPRWINLGVMLLVALLTALDGGMMLYWKLVYSPRRARAGDTRRGPNSRARIVTPPEGFTAEGAKLSAVPAARAGWVVRYATGKCEFCRQDEPRWGSLSADLLRLGYRIIVVPPSADYAYPDRAIMEAGMQQMTYVSMEWIGKFRLLATPTTLVFGPKGQLLWSHVGTLSPADHTAAIRAVQTARLE